MHLFNNSASQLQISSFQLERGGEGETSQKKKTNLIKSDLPASIVRIMTPLLCPREQEALPIQYMRMTQKDNMALFQLISSSSFTPPPSRGIKVLPVHGHPYWLS